MRVASLDQVGIVAVHGLDEITQAFAQDRMNTTGEATGAIHEIGRQLLEDMLAILNQEGFERVRTCPLLPVSLPDEA